MTSAVERARRAAGVPAPWTRTRLRTARGASLAFAALVLLTAFLAAYFPRAVRANEDRAVRRAVAETSPARAVVDVGLIRPDLAPDERAKTFDAGRVTAGYRALLKTVPEPVRVDTGQSSYGVRTSKDLQATDKDLPSPDAVLPRFTAAAQAGLEEHARLASGRWPRTKAGAPAEAGRVEVAVTGATAQALGLTVGRSVHVEGGDTAFVVVGIVEPRDPRGAWWSAEPQLRTPTMSATSGRPPQKFWRAGLLLPPGAGAALLDTLGQPEAYWRLAPRSEGLTAGVLPRYTAALGSLKGGPDLLRVKKAVEAHAVVSTDLDQVIEAHRGLSRALSPVVKVAAVGAGAVAAVTVAMAAGLSAGRRREEFALLRARGASLTGLGGRLLAESAALAVPAAGLGLLGAWALEPAGPLGSSALAAGAVALLGCLALPLRALASHRAAGVHQEREDLVAARPGRGRTVAELTVLAVALLVLFASRRGNGGAGAVPVLLALVAALVLVRCYPLPLRWAARGAGRSRGLTGFLFFARAGRAAPSGTLPLFVLLIAVTTAGVGGAVLTDVAGARDRAALVTAGADARVSATGALAALPRDVERGVRKVAGVRDVAPVLIDQTVALPVESGAASTRPLALMAVDPSSYGSFLREQGLGSAPVPPRAERGGVVDVVASARVAKVFGSGPREVSSLAGRVRVRVTRVAEAPPALGGADFLLMDRAALDRRPTTDLLVAGEPDAKALRKLVDGAEPRPALRLRADARAAYADSPLQAGVTRLFAAAVGAAGGYALLALLLHAQAGAAERTALLVRLRVLGLSRRGTRTLTLLDALPQTVLAAGGGALVGWGAIRLLAPVLDLERLAFASTDGRGPEGVTASLHSGAEVLLLPAAGIAVLAALVSLGQAWWLRRTKMITELRAGDA
ncbi:ABC transporter permease [Streptomyces sp. DSM 41982]|uniref:ABC transporter permease n=2 Tax=Streptomyces TaxID=1883 RepID=A0ABD5E648_9ACTN|nr:ABC transporter permease [Streptomyces sp. DSM 41982]MDT0416780.1 ABC transporter permease [Streptomyces sp. DSM 41982]